MDTDTAFPQWLYIMSLSRTTCLVAMPENGVRRDATHQIPNLILSPPATRKIWVPVVSAGV